MNIARKMEAIFIAAIALIGMVAFATLPAAPRTTPTIASADKFATVTISGKRLTAVQKASMESQS